MKSYDNASIAEQDERGKIVRTKKQGLEEKTYQVIKKCWERNMAIEDIIDIAEIPMEQVLKIIEKIKES